MDKEASRQAWERLHRARNAHKELLGSTSFEEAESAWSDFITHAATIFSKLEKGAKGHNKSEPWFGIIKSQRKTDPLLIYVHQARNTDEHGIAKITDREMGFMRLRAEGGGVHIRGMEIDERGRVAHLDATPTAPGGRVIIETKPATLKLVPVSNDIYKDTFNPPTMHLGRPLKDGSPSEVATLALEFLEAIVKHASSLTK